jgi:DNA repair exonuclease SbcCD ATPase subunit
MSQRANVTSMEAIAAFRSHLLVYLSKARPTLEEISAEVQRLHQWLQTSQRSHFEMEVRRRTRQLEEAQAAMFSARMSNLSEVSSAEQAAVHRARRALDEAQDKLKKVKQWDRDYENSTDPLVKQLEKLNNLLAVEIPNASAYLDQTFGTLDAYARMKPESGAAELTPRADAATESAPAADEAGSGKEPS